MPDLHQYEPALANSVTDATVATSEGGCVAMTLGTGAAPALCFGTGAPAFPAPKGSLYLNVAGTTTNDRLYSCSVATGTWVAITTAS
jgi:hypothetical protein